MLRRQLSYFPWQSVRSDLQLEQHEIQNVALNGVLTYRVCKPFRLCSASPRSRSGAPEVLNVSFAESFLLCFTVLFLSSSRERQIRLDLRCFAREREKTQFSGWDLFCVNYILINIDNSIGQRYVQCVLGLWALSFAPHSLLCLLGGGFRWILIYRSSNSSNRFAIAVY